MKVYLKKEESLVQTILEGRKLECADYRLMKYVVQVEYQGGTLLHNAVTGQMIALSPEETAWLEDLPSAEADWAEKMVNMFFLVPSDENEKEEADRLRSLVRSASKTKVINRYVIYPTTNCNARCYYCFEKGMPCKDMTPETADQLVEYIAEHSDGELVILKWFGGDPLMNVSIIHQICRELRKLGIRYRSEMITNGYLFTPEMMDQAVSEWELKQVQITLDGTEEVYNQVKAYAGNPDHPYQRVMENIRGLLDRGIRVSIRLNLDSLNSENMNHLVDELAFRFGTEQNLYVYVKVVFEGCGTVGIRDERERLRLYLQGEALNDRLNALKLRQPSYELPELQNFCCSADNLRNRVVDPEGRLFLCDTIREGDQVGSIWTDELDEETVKRDQELAEIPRCVECPLYPSCRRLKCCACAEGVNDVACAEKLKHVKMNMLYWAQRMDRQQADEGQRMAVIIPSTAVRRRLEDVVRNIRKEEKRPAGGVKYEKPRMEIVHIDPTNVCFTSGDVCWDHMVDSDTHCGEYSRSNGFCFSGNECSYNGNSDYFTCRPYY